MPLAPRVRSAAALLAAILGFAGGDRGISAAHGAASSAPTGGAAAGQSESGESFRERRAVRGSPVDEAVAAESAELRELRRFDEQVFPRDGSLPMAPTEAEGTAGVEGLPAELDGRWNGSGDVPSVLRTPESARAPARVATQPESAWLRSLKLPELPVRWDPRVVRYLEFFKNDSKGRSIMAGWLRRLGRFKAAFEVALDREGLPRDLLYLAMIESGFEPGAVSRVGAGGLWQFMPGAARAYGLEVSYWVDRRRDPERAAEAAARYLKDLYVRFGSWPLAFAAYNAGYGAILKSIARYNTNDFWELCRHEAGLPWETSLYVPKILAAAIVGHNAATFGFGEIASDPPFAYDVAEVPPATPLALIARAAGTSADEIQALNPELVRGRTPPDRGSSKVRLPPGTGATFALELGKATSAERIDRVVLRFGETLEDLARARGTSVRELRRLNGLKDSAELRGGTTVLVPARAGATPAVAADGDDAGKDEPTIVAVPDRTFSYEGRERVFYRTREGDSVEEIAEVFHVGADEIGEWNNVDVGAKLQPKMVLQLFVAKDLDRSQVALLDPSRVRVVTLGSEEFHELEAARRGKTRLLYTARPGDTLAKIARRYGLAPGDLARINRLSYSAELGDGQRIVVYSPTPELPRELTARNAAAGRSGPLHHRGPEPAKPQPPTASKRASASAPKPGATTKPAPKPAKQPAAPVAKAIASKPAVKPAVAKATKR